MEATTLEKIAHWSGGRLVAGDASAIATTIGIDSRTIKAGDLFLALRGASFDGHEFVAGAAKRGALGAVVDHVPAGLSGDFAVVQVADTLRALQQIAAGYRRSMPAQIICVTGSNGKTSTKDLAAVVLRERFQVTKTEGNFNNHVGLPLTMLRLRAADRVGVFEIGTNHHGEIATLSALAQPDIAIITNIGVAHIEHLGSREGIAKEKGMLAEALQPGGTLIINADDEFTPGIVARTRADVLRCGLGEDADIRATDLRQDFAGMKFRLHAFGRSVDAQIPVPGVHMVSNATLAVGAGHVFGMTLEECALGLPNLQLTKGRLEMKVVRGIQVIDDSYNANPDSVKAALLTLAQMSTNGRRIAVLGRMGELGVESERGHRAVGQTASDLGLDFVMSIGEEATLIADEAWRGGVAKVVKAADVDEAVRELREFVHAGDLVLIKGSRSARMERIVEGLAAA
ncbi:MAG: UDP-N-acetylmuramoyl-tripeptide--D-alanyl-D-alanine ligase [Chthoniobacteraceae bacterium]